MRRFPTQQFWRTSAEGRANSDVLRREKVAAPKSFRDEFVLRKWSKNLLERIAIFFHAAGVARRRQALARRGYK